MTERAGIEAYLDLLEEAFRGRGIEASNESQAFLTNLASVPETAWRALPVGAVRTIESIALDVGACKVMYEHYAFGSASLRFASPAVEPFREGEARRSDIVSWIERAHGDLVAHVAGLPDDAELQRPRLTNWGERRPTRWIIAAMITHDAYHAGEINHLRSLAGSDDRWRHVQAGFG